MPPSRDDFARWRDDPVTRWVMAAHKAAADQNKTAWANAAWTTGNASPGALMEARTRADTFMAIVDAEYIDFCAMLGEEPRED